jgi:SAM-dependent methyltransferase
MDRITSGAAVQAGERPDRYYHCSRPEVAALVPPGCQRVLDIGCGSGQLGRLLVERGHHVTGIELVPEIAEEARSWLDHVAVADVEADGFPFADDSFDTIIFADVLEHFVDPWRVLREAVDLLEPGGQVIASIPNLQHIDVITRLIRGRWHYRDHGITDYGHLRFFTLATIRDLFAQANLEVVRVEYLARRTPWRSLLAFLTAGWARAFFTRRYLVVGRKAGAIE